MFHDEHVRVAEVEFMGKCLPGDSRGEPPRERRGASRGAAHRGWHTVRRAMPGRSEFLQVWCAALGLEGCYN